MPGVSTYETAFKDLEPILGASGPGWVKDLRRNGIDAFKELGFPSLRNEAWRGTRIKPIAERDFKPVPTYKPNGLSADQIINLSFDDADCHRITMIDGHYASQLSIIDGLPKGVRLASLKETLAESPALVEPHLGKHAPADNPFVALNNAFIADGVFLQIPDNAIVERPVHMLFISSGTGTVVHPRVLVVAGKNAEATIVESHVGTGADYFTNIVTEIVCDENATVSHCKLQRDDESAFHIATQQTRLAGNSNFSTENISFGGALVRNDVNSHLDGEGIDCRVDGLYLANNSQHVDNHTLIRHAKPHCHSFELYKGILNGKSRGVFNGKIYVDPDAQKTDAKQSNNCILLSDDARINTNPQLEIFADDVKCTHGATVGQLDEDSVFYMRSRGIDNVHARHILIYAFAAEVIERIKVENLRDRLEVDLFWWLSKTFTL